MRQLLATKVSGNLLGLWLLIPEHLRLGTWDLVCGWARTPPEQVEPRLALQLVHESALCVTGVRQQRTLSQRGFELAHGLPFVASDLAMHQLLNTHSVAESQRLQVALGKLRRASGDFPGPLLAVDPHRIPSSSKRQMRRFRTDQRTKPYKVVQTFFALDPDSHQPVCLTIASSAKTVTTATKELLDLSAEILSPTPGERLILADLEHSTAELLDYVKAQTPFDLLVPQMNQPSIVKQFQQIPADQFQPRWAGFATLKRRYSLFRGKHGPYWQFVQRSGETPETYRFQAFLCTADRDEVDALTAEFPKRWHVEEFFNTDQALGWNRGGTLNLNIRYGQMTMALLAQAVLHQLRNRLGEPFASWEAGHFAKSMLAGLDGDIRVQGNTIIVTYYNAPHADQLRHTYEHLPRRLAEENIPAEIPWLYNFKLDFRFK